MSKKFVCPCSCDLPVTNDPGKIIVHGAREHNLKNICFEIPKGKLVALTGPSGSGKSSIAVEVLQKECLRQLLESLGMTTDHISKAKVHHIMGLSPSIGVSQRVTDFNPRSTVGTKTGILTILRNLFASIGHQPCAGQK
jgi:excinuclease ABC subunit A